MKKKLLALLMAFAMVVSLLPATAFADAPTPDPLTHSIPSITFTAWTVANSLPEDGGSYYLTADVTLEAGWEIEANTNLDLNGYVINLSGYQITVGGDATFNLYDCGTTEHYFTVGDNGLWTLADEGTETVTGGVITGGSTTGDGGGVYVNADGTFTMNGGNIVGNTATGNGGVCVEGTFTMNGGSIVGNTASNGGGVYVGASGTFTMNGGSIVGNTVTGEGNGGGVYVKDGNLILGGTAVVKDNLKGTVPNDVASCDSNSTISISTDVPPEKGMYVGLYDDKDQGTPSVIVQSAKEEYRWYFFSDDPIKYVNCDKVYDGGCKFMLASRIKIDNATDLAYHISECIQPIYLSADINYEDSTYGGSDTLNVAKDKTLDLDLNGKVLNLNGKSNITVSEGGTFILRDDGTAEGHKFKADDNGLWKLADEGTETVTGGVITGGTAANGGGVYVNAGGTFTMNGGNIVGNAATNSTGNTGGGGVYVNAGGTFTMNGGNIVGNTAKRHGGGVYVDGTFTMTDGTISNNTASVQGGGVRSSGEFKMIAGTITGNTANYGGGIAYSSSNLYLTADTGKTITITRNTATSAGGGVYDISNNMHLSGKVIIRENDCTANKALANLMMYNGAKPIVIDGALTGSEIYVIHATNSGGPVVDAGVLTSGYNTFNPNTEATDFFHYDGPGDFVMVLNANGELEVVGAAAKIGTTGYATLTEALGAAEVNGDTVVLQKDAEVALAEVAPNVTLDLKEHNLEATTVLSWGLIKDSVGSGKLIVAQDHFAYFGGKEMAASDENVMPVWDTNNYVFYAVNDIWEEWTPNSEGNPKYKFAPGSSDIGTILAQDSGIKAYVDFSYEQTDANSQTHQKHLTVEFGQSYLTQYLEDPTKLCMYVTLLGTEGVSIITAKSYLKAENCNFSIASEPIQYSGN